MSPEALAGLPPSPGFDLWSLTVVLHEALTDRHPAEPAGGTTGAEGASPLNESWRAFFASALGPVEHERPQTARELRRALEPLTSSSDAH